MYLPANTLSVRRDLGFLVVLVQLTIASIAKVVHLLDRDEVIPTLFPKDWAARNATVLAVGPYYCTGAFFFFAGEPSYLVAHPHMHK